MKLIDGNALRKEFEDLAENEWNKDTVTTCSRAFRESAERVDDAAAVDAVPVVRCADCKHFGELTEEEKDLYQIRFDGLCEFWDNHVVDYSWYCSMGKKKEPQIDHWGYPRYSCSRCGHQYTKGQRFCEYCGERLEDE